MKDFRRVIESGRVFLALWAATKARYICVNGAGMC